MQINDKFSKPVGHFKIETFKKNKLIDSFEEHNLIMNKAREHFMKVLSGMYAENKAINCLKLGTRGVQEVENDGKIEQFDAIPKDADSGFNDSRTDLFCGTPVSTQGIEWAGISFTPSGDVDTSRASNTTDGGNNDSTVDIYIVTTGESPTLTYVFNISADAFNGATGYAKYNEAGLYADDVLIAMRTFRSKSKDSETSMRITWSISF